MAENKTGIAFSGGGIRSAALCSGVLRRLLHRGVHVDYVSCVSGGNYTAAAYLDWKYRHDKRDDHTWHQEFFEHMRKRVGYICHWQGGWQGLLDTIIYDHNNQLNYSLCYVQRGRIYQRVHH